MSTIYTMKFRPVSTVTLPPGIRYELVALPHDFHGNRPDLKRSERHRFGEFTTDRPLSADEMRDFEIVEAI